MTYVCMCQCLFDIHGDCSVDHWCLMHWPGNYLSSAVWTGGAKYGDAASCMKCSSVQLFHWETVSNRQPSDVFQ